MLLEQSYNEARGVGLDDPVFLALRRDCALSADLAEQLRGEARLWRDSPDQCSGWVDRAALGRVVRDLLPAADFELPPLADNHYWQLVARPGLLQIIAMEYHEDTDSDGVRSGRRSRRIGRPAIYSFAEA